MEAYSRYKDSGIDWIEEIPDTWNLKKIKHTTYIKGRVGWKGLTSDEFLKDGYSYLITGTDFNKGKIKWDTCYHIDQERYEDDPFIQLREDDLLITKDGTIGKVALVKDLNGYACLNSGIFVLRPNTTDYITQYMYWVLNSDVFTEFNKFTQSGSTIKHLYQNVFVELKFPTPSIEEQTTIANFLDHKTAQIDDSITKRRQLIELLKEQRKAIINEAVTKGINSNVKMKDSGIEWIGEIPENWEVKKVKYLCKEIISGPFGSSIKKEIYTKEGYKVYGQEQVIPNDFSIGNYYIPEVEYKRLIRYSINSYDILISCVGTFGKIAVVPPNFEKGIINPRLIKIAPDQSIVNPQYLECVLRSPFSFNQFNYFSRGGTMGVINISLLSKLIMPLPTFKEQKQILKYIGVVTSEVNQEIQSTQKEITLLEEYRLSLITEAVTGKIDVRDYKLN